MHRVITAALATLAAAAPALAAPLAIVPLRAATVAQQAAGTLGAGQFCTSPAPASPSEMRHAIEAGALDVRLKRDLAKAGVTIDTAGLAPLKLSGEIRILRFAGCFPSWGIASFDTASGKVEMAVDWTLTDRLTGAAVARLQTHEYVERKNGSGGMEWVLSDALAPHVRALTAQPAFREALARPVLAAASPEPPPPPGPPRVTVHPWRPTAFRGDAWGVKQLPQIFESDIDATDQDRTSARESFKFDGSAGEVLSVSISDYAQVGRLSLRTFAGAPVAETSEMLNPTLKAVLPAAGAYVVTFTVTQEPRFGPYRITLQSNLRPANPQPPPPAPVAPVRQAQTTPAPAPASKPAAKPASAGRPSFAPPLFVK